MAESGSPWQTHRTFLKYRAKQKRTALIRHCRWHKIPQTDNWVFPKCPRQLRSRAPGEPPKGESSTLSRARSGLLSRPQQRRNAVSEANQRTQSDPAFLKYRERVVTANRLHGCQSRERRDRDYQMRCLMLFPASMEDQIVPGISLLRASKTRFTAYWRPCETFDQARYFRNTSRYFRNRITVQWERPAGYFRNAETVLRERLTFPDSPRIRESRCKRPQPNFLSYLLKELTAPAALPLFRRFLEGEGTLTE